MKILNFGSLNNDNVYSLDHIVIPGETISSSGMNVFCGGKGLNQSISLAKAGANVYHAGMIGHDGQNLLDVCKEYGVNSDFIKVIDEKSGHTIIQVDKNGQNCIILYGGANMCITKEYVDNVLENFDSGDMLLLQNEINLVDYIIDEAYKKGMTIALNPSPFNENILKCDLSKITLFLLNEIEGNQITGKTEAEDILDALKQKYPEAKTVLTLGKQGAIYQYKDTRVSQPIYNIKVVDTTAAGDTFTGYFISSVIDNVAPQKALKIATVASAIAVSRQGAVNSIPLKKEVEELYNEVAK